MKNIILFLLAIAFGPYLNAQSTGVEIGMNYGFSHVRAVSDHESPFEDYTFHTTKGNQFGIFANFRLINGLDLTTHVNINEKELEFSPSFSSDYNQSYENYAFQVGLKTKLKDSKFGIFLRPFLGVEYLRTRSYAFDYAFICCVDPLSSFIPMEEVRKFNIVGGLGLGMEYNFARGITLGFQPEISLQLLPAIKSPESPYISPNHRFSTMLWSLSISKKI